MNSKVVFQQTDAIAEIKSFLAISIILPVQNLTTNSQLENALKLIMDKIERHLADLYSEKRTAPIINKLKTLIRKFNYNRPKKGIAIFVSPFVEEVYYLKADVNKKIVIDEFFENGDELLKKQSSYVL